MAARGRTVNKDEGGGNCFCVVTNLFSRANEIEGITHSKPSAYVLAFKNNSIPELTFFGREAVLQASLVDRGRHIAPRLRYLRLQEIRNRLLFKYLTRRLKFA